MIIWQNTMLVSQENVEKIRQFKEKDPSLESIQTELEPSSAIYQLNCPGKLFNNNCPLRELL